MKVEGGGVSVYVGDGGGLKIGGTNKGGRKWSQCIYWG